MEIRTTDGIVERKIAIGLIGYESGKEFKRAMDPWVGHVDMFIAGDGKFDNYDAPNDFSEDGWLDKAEKRYGDKVEFVGYQYAGDQIPKRQMYLDIAGKFKCDYLIAVDTDEYLDPYYQDWELFYGNLDFVGSREPDRMFYQWVYIPDEKTWSKQGNVFQEEAWRMSAKIHKDPGTMRFCANSHFMWCSKDTTDETIYQWALDNKPKDPNDIKINPHMFMPMYAIDGVRVQMDRTLRDPIHVKKGEVWAKLNQHREKSKEFYALMTLMKTKPPKGFNSWQEFADKPHTFNVETGERIEL